MMRPQYAFVMENVLALHINKSTNKAIVYHEQKLNLKVLKGPAQGVLSHSEQGC